MELNRFFDLMEAVRQKASVEAVFGPPTQVGDRTIIPVGRVSYGFGLGFGQGTGPEPEVAEGEAGQASSGVGGGSGARLKVQPVAVLEVAPETTTIKPILDEDRLFRTAILVGAWSVFWLARPLSKIFGQKG